MTKTVNVVNKSKKAITFNLDCETEYENNAISFRKEQITIKPKEVLPIEVRFNPKTRMPNFTHDIGLHIEGAESRKLFTVVGVSHGIEVKLMEEVIGFGTVVEGSRLSKKVQLINFGDVPGKYNFLPGEYNKQFTITPDHGIIPPHEDINLTITFHPNKVGKYKYEKLVCEIAGGENISMTLLGTCQAHDGKTEEVKFETIVRKQVQQNVPIQNPTDKEWQIRPTISGPEDVFKADVAMTVSAKGTANYVITYCP